MFLKRRKLAAGMLALLVSGACSPRLTAQSTGAANGKMLKVMSYNIHHANPPSKAKEGVIDIDAIAAVINKAAPDIVGLQEVDKLTKRSGYIDEAQLIAQKTHMHYQFFKAIDHDGGEYGLAILSRSPIKGSVKVNLPQVFKGEARILSYAQLNIQGQNITFANTHLDAQRPDSNRIVQMQRIAAELDKQQGPILITGDFNSEAERPTIAILDKAFKRSCIDGCAFTIPQINPNKTIDFIAIKNADWKVLKHEVIAEEYASDHRPVLVTYQLNK